MYAAQPTPRNRDAFNVDLYQIDLRSGAETRIVTQPGRDAEPSYSPDGRWIAFHSQAGSANYFEARHIAIVPSAGGPIRLHYGRSGLGCIPKWEQLHLGARLAQRDVHGWQRRPGRGHHHDLTANDAAIVAEQVSGSRKLYCRWIPMCVPEDQPGTPPRSLFVAWSDRNEADAYSGCVVRPSSHRIESRSLVGFRRIAIEGVLWLPVNYPPGTRVPLLTELHGGPTGSRSQLPTPRVYPFRFFLNMELRFFRPTSVGLQTMAQRFRLKNACSQGIGDYDDVMSGIDLLVSEGIADPDRLGVMGWSYGGYLTGSVITQTNRFKAASIGAPATDWFTYYGQSDAGPEILSTYFGGSPVGQSGELCPALLTWGLKNIRTPALSR